MPDETVEERIRRLHADGLDVSLGTRGTSLGRVIEVSLRHDGIRYSQVHALSVDVEHLGMEWVGHALIEKVLFAAGLEDTRDV